MPFGTMLFQGFLSFLNKPGTLQLISINHIKMMNSKRKKKIFANKKTYCSSRGIYLILYSQIKQTRCNHQNETSETTQNNSTG